MRTPTSLSPLRKAMPFWPQAAAMKVKDDAIAAYKEARDRELEAGVIHAD